MPSAAAFLTQDAFGPNAVSRSSSASPAALERSSDSSSFSDYLEMERSKSQAQTRKTSDVASRSAARSSSTDKPSETRRTSDDVDQADHVESVDSSADTNDENKTAPAGTTSSNSKDDNTEQETTPDNSKDGSSEADGAAPASNTPPAAVLDTVELASKSSRETSKQQGPTPAANNPVQDVLPAPNGADPAVSPDQSKAAIGGISRPATGQTPEIVQSPTADASALDRASDTPQADEIRMVTVAVPAEKPAQKVATTPPNDTKHGEPISTSVLTTPNGNASRKSENAPENRTQKKADSSTQTHVSTAAIAEDTPAKAQVQQSIPAPASPVDRLAVKLDASAQPLQSIDGLPVAATDAAHSAKSAEITLRVTMQGPRPHLPTHDLAVQIVRQFEGRSSNFEIRLDPPELGRIDVKLEIGHDGAVRAHLSADRPETLDLLQRDSKALERALQNLGLDTDSDTLDFSLRQDGNRGRNAQREDQTNAGRSTTPEIELVAASSASTPYVAGDLRVNIVI